MPGTSSNQSRRLPNSMRTVPDNVSRLSRRSSSFTALRTSYPNDFKTVHTLSFVPSCPIGVRYGRGRRVYAYLLNVVELFSGRDGHDVNVMRNLHGCIAQHSHSLRELPARPNIHSTTDHAAETVPDESLTTMSCEDIEASVNTPASSHLPPRYGTSHPCVHPSRTAVSPCRPHGNLALQTL